MSITTRISKEQFTQEELEWWADFVAARMRDAMGKMKIGVTDELEASIRAEAKKDLGQLSFLGYGRFRDMGAGRGYNKGQETLSARRAAKTTKRKKRTPKKFYSKVAYGTINRLIMNLTSKYQEATIEGLKENILKSL